MLKSIGVTHAETELEYQAIKVSQDDNLERYSLDMMLKRLEPDGQGGLHIIETKQAKDYRNTLRRKAVLQNLLIGYRE